MDNKLLINQVRMITNIS